jgi:hypothetical protein
MSDETPKKYPKHEGVKLKFLRFAAGCDLPAAGSQISHAKCAEEPLPAGQSHTASYHGAGGMYELRHYINGTLSETFWIPRERIAYHQVLA